MAAAYTVRDRLLSAGSQDAHDPSASAGPSAYLSAEFLLGPHWATNMVNLGIPEPVRRRSRLGLDLEDHPGAGGGAGPGQRRSGAAGGLLHGSLATLEIPAIGYGIRYEFGIFDQEIQDGWQVEMTDNWLRNGNPWEIAAPEIALRGQIRRPHRSLSRRTGPACGCAGCRAAGQGIAYDTPILGYGVRQRRICCGCGSPRRAESFDSRPSTSATTTARCTTRSRRRPSPRSSTPTTSREAARSCA